jgi:hypothetical protein
MPPSGSHSSSTPHDLVDEELRVTVDVKPLDPDLGGDAKAMDEGLILHHIVYAEMQSNHVEEPISLGGDQHHAPTSPLRVKKSSKYMLQCSRVIGAGGCFGPFHLKVR